MKILINLVCCLVPNRRWRHLLRVRLADLRYRLPILYKTRIGKGACILGKCDLNHNTSLGDGSTIMGLTVIGKGAVNIGRYAHIAAGCTILTQNHDYDTGREIPFDALNDCKDVQISDFAWLGMNVTVLPGTVIEEGAIIQAGSVVHGRIPRCAIAGGNPAKVFKTRNVEHFESLKKQGAFHGAV